MRFYKDGAFKHKANGANGREYVIGYALGQDKPWVVERDNSRHRTLNQAESHCHEIEGKILDREADK